jgi:prevent-host-death family protein
MDVFSVRDLRDRSGDLVREAESGRLSLVAKHGKPLFVAVPLDEHLLREGVAVCLALRLYADGTVSAGKAARLAGLTPAAFQDRLAQAGIPQISYPAEELAGELTALS